MKVRNGGRWFGTAHVGKSIAIGVMATAAGASALAPAAMAASHSSTTASVLAATRGKLGSILVTSTGLTLYTYSKDTKNHSNCTGGCAAVWPPYLLSVGVKTASAGKGVSGLGTIKRGTRYQVTENNRPLYTFAGTKSGNTSGNGVNGFAVVKSSSKSSTTTTTAAANSGYGGYS